MANNDRRYAVWNDACFNLRRVLKDFEARRADKWLEEYETDKHSVDEVIIPHLKKALFACNSLLLDALKEQNAELMRVDESEITSCKLSELWNKEEANEPAEVSDQ